MNLAAPDRPNVLVTSAARKVLLVRAFREALERCAADAGPGTGSAAIPGRVIAADVSPLAAALYEADEARLIPRSDDPAFVEALLHLCERDRIGLLVPTRDEELPVLAQARDRFAAAGTAVLVASLDAVETCRDKQAFVAAVTAAGLAVPVVYPDPTAARFPAFVKPRSGKGGLGAAKAADASELAAAIATIGGDVLIQAFVEAPEFTIDVFLDFDGRPISCVPRERISVVAGESVVGRTVRDAALSDAAIRLCVAIGLVGHVTVQAFRNATEISFIEINPRYGGAANLGFAAGAPTPEFAIRAARGEHLEPRLDDYEAGLYLFRHSADLFVREADLLPHETDG